MFKSIRAYECHPDLTIPDELNGLLDITMPFVPAKPTELSASGFVTFDDGLICFKSEEKILPASAINKRVAERVADLGRPAHRKEIAGIKEDVIHELLPKAFSKYHLTYAYFHNGYLVTDASSASRAESLTAGLRSVLGSLPIKPFNIGYDARQWFTTMLKNRETSVPFQFGQDATLEDYEKSRAKVTGVELIGTEVAEHLSHGKECIELSLVIPEVAELLIREDWSVKSLAVSDCVEFDEIPDATPEQRIGADYYIYRELVDIILKAIKGATA